MDHPISPVPIEYRQSRAAIYSVLLGASPEGMSFFADLCSSAPDLNPPIFSK
jgi:hypothetical protein